MKAVDSALAKHGLLLLQDKVLPNVVTTVTGERVSGSWWSHRRGQDIFRAVSQLSDREDVIVVKLVGSKVTFVHRKLWPALFAVASAREPWQMDGLSRQARALLRRVDDAGSVRSTGAATRELELRLLVGTSEVHTESGRHEKVLERWPASTMPLDRARRAIEAALIALGGTVKLLPWHRRIQRA